MKQNRFLLTSDECELLLELEKAQTIEKTAKAVGKDSSGVSRQLSKIAQKYPAIEKRAGKWVLTEVGKRLNSISRDTIQIQQQLAEEQTILRIGTNREFAARVLAPQLSHFRELFGSTQLIIYTFEYGTEAALLSGQIDVGLDCERPNDPEIAYKLLADEPIIKVCSKKFKTKYKTEIQEKHLERIPHLLCERLYPDKILLQKENRQHIVACFNDIATARAACVSGLGWALLPHYSVREELKQGQLVQIENSPTGKAKYGVWWSRTRYSNKKAIHSICEWLKEQKL